MQEVTKKLIEEIENDLKNQIDLKTLKTNNPLYLHFGVGMYIRNKYLWKNPELCKKLSLDFGSSHPDEISSEIIQYIKEKNHLN